VVIHILDDTFFIDNENYSIIKTILGQHFELLGDFAMWEKIGQKRIGDPAKGFGPGFMAGNGVD
jgi:hypothetical protein